MKRINAFIVIAALVGILTSLLGFPVMVEGVFSIRGALIIILLDVIFYIILFSKPD